MNDWGSCLVSDIDTNSFRLGYCNIANYSVVEKKFVDWIVNSSFYAGRLEERTFPLPFGDYYKFSAEGFSNKLNRKIIGTGRSDNRLSGVSKSLGEVFERIVSFEAMREELTSNFLVELNDGDVSINNVSHKESKGLLPKELRNSNGWAIHFDINVAICSSILEAIERHIILFTFFKDDWNGFYCNESPSFQDISLRSLISKYSIGGFSAGICVSQCNRHPGITMGYLSDYTENIAHSDGWKKSFFESVEQALYYKERAAEADAKAVEYGYADLEKNQLFYLNQKFELNGACAFENLVASPIRKIFDRASMNLIVIDIQKKLGLDFPMFAAYSYGGDMIPLYFSGAIKNQLACDYILSQLRKNGLPEVVPEIHPIV